MNDRSSYRTILRSSSIIGGASVLNVLVGLLRNKAAAILLGPSGVGFIGLLLNLMQAAGALAAFGLGNVGTRQIAEAAARHDERGLARARRALFWGTLALATSGAVVFYALRYLLADKILGDTLQASTVGWLSLGVFLTVGSSSQQALLNGLRRIGDLARIQIGSALLSALLGVAALVLWGQRGIVGFIIVAPLTTCILGHFYVARVRKNAAVNSLFRDLVGEWRVMLRLGFAFMVSSVMVMGGNLAVRSTIQHQLGDVPLGQFQAAWTISMTYIGFVLSAMATDYYPRLTGVIHDHELAVRTVNQQTEVALLLAGPVLITVLSTAPWVIWLVYSSRFAPAAEILRWQVTGDILKVASWPMSFILLAAGAARTFMFTEAMATGIFVFGTVLGLPRFGIVATGHSFALMYAVYLPSIFLIGRRRIGMRWTAAVKLHLTSLIAIAAVVMILAAYSDIIAAAFGLVAAVILGMLALVRLSKMAELSSVFPRITLICEKLTGNKGPKR